MSAQAAPATEVIAVHGWAGDSRAWAPWAALANERGWRFRCCERGYGQLPPALPHWDPASGRRIVIAHSLGPHLLPEATWREASAAVLLTSFAAFLPPGRQRRPLAASLRGMAAQLEAGEEATAAMLRQFFAKVADPFPASRLPEGPLEQGIPDEGRQRLLDDLQLLARCTALPAGLPPQIPVLLVEARDDQIVCEASRALLRQALPQATVWSLERAGHGLLGGEGPRPGQDLLSAVLEWMADGPP
jgi:pimeloyl-[acyl-carrier protein] methyl ester esterase